MGFTDKFRAQHDEILAMAGGISRMLEAREPDIMAVRKQLSLLAGKVNFHLAMEDKALYPRLMERKGTRAEAMAGKFMSEMGGLAQVFGNYTSKWQPSAIRADLPGFANETRKVFGALAKRIERENSDLYPLADLDK
jgi:iron-sulfur cluster repair protein YtfE (RIC family)